MDPVSANRIDSNDRQRILRALEINILTSNPVSECTSSDGLAKTGIKVSRISINVSDRRTLHRGIDDRLRGMIDAGLIEEVRGIRSRYPQCRETPAMKSVGYKQVWSHLENEVDERQMILVISGLKMFCLRAITAFIKAMRDMLALLGVFAVCLARSPLVGWPPYGRAPVE